MRNKTKAWRKEACPRSDDGKKIKGRNRSVKNAGQNMRLPVGLHPLMLAMFKRAGIQTV